MIFINVIYIDVLLMTNFIICTAFLLMVKKLTHTHVGSFFIALGGIIGSLSSLVILTDNRFTGLTLKLIILLVQIAVCFKTVNISRILKLSLVYFLINLSYTGICIIVWNLLGKKLFYIKNMTVYFDVSTGMLIGITIAVYVIMSVFEAVFFKSYDTNQSFTAEFEISENKYKVKAVADTGNMLNDCYYGKPVAVLTSDVINSVLNLSDENSIIKNKLHILPCKTVSSDGILYVTVPTTVRISTENDTKYCEVCIGISNNKCDEEKLIFNPKILI